MRQGSQTKNTSPEWQANGSTTNLAEQLASFILAMVFLVDDKLWHIGQRRRFGF